MLFNLCPCQGPWCSASFLLLKFQKKGLEMAGARASPRRAPAEEVEEGSFTVEVVDAAVEPAGDGVVLTQLQVSRACTFTR